MPVPYDILHGAPGLEADISRLGGLGAEYQESLHHELRDDQLTTDELAVLSVIDGAATVVHILAEAGRAPAETIRILFGLIGRGVIWRKDRAPH